MPRKVFDDINISRGKNFGKACALLFPDASRRKVGALLGGVPEATIRTWEKGKPIANRALAEIERRGISLAWLLRSEGAAFTDGLAPAEPIKFPPVAEIPEPEGKRITLSGDVLPVRGLAAADDSGGTRVPDTDEFTEPVRLPNNLLGVPLIGDSMSPVALEGQLAMIDREREGFEKDDGIYVVSIVEPEPGDDYPEPIIGTFIKRCEKRENLYYLKSFNTFSPFSAHVDHCRLWPVLGVWFNDKGKPPEGF